VFRDWYERLPRHALLAIYSGGACFLAIVAVVVVGNIMWRTTHAEPLPGVWELRECVSVTPRIVRCVAVQGDRRIVVEPDDQGDSRLVNGSQVRLGRFGDDTILLDGTWQVLGVSYLALGVGLIVVAVAIRSTTALVRQVRSDAQTGGPRHARSWP
jgi:hypothetical protein